MTLPDDNPFAYHARELEPDECIPEAGSVAQLGPAAASLLLFKLPLDDDREPAARARDRG